MADQYVDLPVEGGGGGGGAVADVNSITGSVNIVAASGIGVSTFGQNITISNTSALSFPIIAPSGSAGAPSYAFSETGNDTGIYSQGDGDISFSNNAALGMSLDAGHNLTVVGTISASNYPPSGTTNHIAYFNGSGVLDAVSNLEIDVNSSGLYQQVTQQPDGTTNYLRINGLDLNVAPTAAAANATYNQLSLRTSLDTSNSGLSIGTNGTALQSIVVDVFHNGTSDVGGINLLTQTYNLGNGTDPIDVKGIGYAFGFGTVNANVNLSGPIQGYGFQPSINAAATMSAGYINAFYDALNAPIALPSYTSANLSPTIGSITNNNNYTGINNSPNITSLLGNAGFTGMGMFPNIGALSPSGGYQGIVVNPTIGTADTYISCIATSPQVTLNKGNAVGISVNMGGVTNDPGSVATLVVQDITYTTISPGIDSNNTTVEYTDTTTAGNEVAVVNSPAHIVVSIESGVSTATQVKAALDANPTIVTNMVTTITGVASNTQVTYAQTNLAGGINPGTAKAAEFNGDVSINGALSFTGGLSIGALQSFATKDIATLSAGVQSIDTLITQPFIAANATHTGSDLLGINTAMLMTLGDNATVTSNFLGYAALGLPAVVSMGTGATIDLVSGATFAISLDAGATGGTIAEVDLCRALALPNGVTTVTKLKGYAFDLPFGDPGTTTWGVHIGPAVHNYMAGDLMVGGTAGSDDTPANSSVGIELKSTVKAFLPSRMTAAERNALTAVNGMILYNTDTDKLQVYAAGSWVDLH